MADEKYSSWGRFPKFRQQGVPLEWRGDDLPEPLEGTATLLPYGNGRSYGDVCLNRGGTVLATRGLARFIAFDEETGVLRAEAGVLLAEILQHVVPDGWFLPVMPGTRFVTLGGAVANDVHGKNHHQAGTLGCHVRSLELLRSDGSRLKCSPEKNAELFRATIGGLGLTGLMTWVEIQLKRVNGATLNTDSIKFSNAQEFFRISEASDGKYEYTVAWIDCMATGRSLGRGLFSRADHADGDLPARSYKPDTPKLSMPITPPFSLVNKLSLKAFNALWYGRQRKKQVSAEVAYKPFFFPLDSIAHWNRMYGRKGMLQYQCVLPGQDGRRMLLDMLKAIAQSGHGSFLAVLKMFADRESPGMLSFPREGVTLALDFPARPDVFRLLDRLDEMTLEVGGAIYPAKDARMSADTFQACFPQWQEFSAHVDPAFSSSFWRRVSGDLSVTD